MNEKVSVIIPVYNVEKYIDRCLKSIIGQTYKNLEIIVIDDGSKDKSGIIADIYQKSDSRIFVIHKENGGLSSARNEGMKYISGKYTMFVDGDDYLEYDAIEALLQHMKDNVEIVLFPYIKEYTTKKVKTRLFDGDKIFSNNQVKKELLASLIGPKDSEKSSPLLIDRLNTAWGKLYKSLVVKSMRFVDTNLIGTEDGWFNINVFGKISGKVVYTEDTWYRYEKSNTRSLLHIYKDDYEKKRWFFYKELEKYIDGNGYTQFKKNMAYRIVEELFGIVVNLNNSGASIGKTANQLRVINKSYNYRKYFDCIDYSRFKFPWNVFYCMCRFGIYEPILFLLRTIDKFRG